MIKGVQSALNFSGAQNPQFADKQGLGRVGLAAFCLGALWGLAAAAVILHVALRGWEVTIAVRLPVLHCTGVH